jgi:hypothetical protein
MSVVVEELNAGQIVSCRVLGVRGSRGAGSKAHRDVWQTQEGSVRGGQIWKRGHEKKKEVWRS